MTTPSNQASGGQTAAAATSSGTGTGTTSALAFVDQLDSTVGELKRELSSYAADANTVGRDTQQLRALFDRILRCDLQIAQAMGIDWTPSSS